MKNLKNKTRFRRIAALLMTAIFLCTYAMVPALAVDEPTGDGGAIASSKFATGTKALINDASVWFMVILPVAVILLSIYFSMRKAAADDEQESKAWSKKIKTAWFCVVVGECSGIIIKAIVSYY